MVRVSGTIKKSEEEAIKRARAAILRAKRETAKDALDSLQAILGSQAASAEAKKQKVGPEDVACGIEDFDDENDVESDPEE